MSILPRALALAAVVVAGHASAAITLFGHEGFHGARVTLTQPAPDFRDFNFNKFVFPGADFQHVAGAEDFRSRIFAAERVVMNHDHVVDQIDDDVLGHFSPGVHL